MFETILNRLFLWQKFFILSLVALVLAGIPTTLYVLEIQKALKSAHAEIDGMEPSATVLKAIQLSQQHRGLATLFLGGVADAEAKRSAKQTEADAAYAAVSERVRGIGNATLQAAWDASRKDWEKLRSDVAEKKISATDSLTAHGALIAGLLKCFDMVNDHYGLSLDGHLDTYQLIQAMYYQLPHLTEETGRMRARGANLLAKKSATPEERLFLSGIISRVSDRLGQFENAYGKATAANAEIDKVLGSAVRDMAARTRSAMELANQKIVQPETLEYSGTEYVAAITTAIDALYATNAQASKEIGSILNERADHLVRVRRIMFAAIVLLIALAGWIQYEIAISVSRPLTASVHAAERVAEGDLSARFDLRATNEIGRLQRALSQMNDSLAGIVRNVRTNIDNISMSAADIAAGNADLSSRTESQASSLEETASSMEELTSTVKQNADNARQANTLVNAASNMARRGGDVVAQVVGTMREINDSSTKIVDIIGVIDGIAFQTNILALNAAVEAARAGEQGRGFAVVAAEVRTLAQRSAAAAKEIKALIDDSVGKVEQGNQLVEDAGKVMTEIVTSVGRVSGMMQDIVMASGEQTDGIEQVNQAIAQLDEATQQNSALVEEAAAASESMSDQAQALLQEISIFRLAEGAGAGRAVIAR